MLLHALSPREEQQAAGLAGVGRTELVVHVAARARTAPRSRTWASSGWGWYSKTDNGVAMVWTDGRVYCPLHAILYTSPITAVRAARGKGMGFACRAVVADCAYSVGDDWYLALRAAGGV
ncbi:hypothetical protein PV726_47155 [Streptomyces europaeiscabiei]|uniref:hypothetical protein n=1 Tax=Streptomyces europaeiscabiei TaxID=146819 RepID=UPI0029A4DDD2|nr:hypothetical protein [Streptomyces europaeiscabiei]MDX3697635.1 hypothetical protein [Streptomyces europaeiscabiei]